MYQVQDSPFYAPGMLTYYTMSALDPSRNTEAYRLKISDGLRDQVVTFNSSNEPLSALPVVKVGGYDALLAT